MSLLEKLQNPPVRSNGRPCSIGKVLSSISDPEEQRALQRMLNEWNAAAVYNALTEEGYTVGVQQIGRHRRHQCSCSSRASR